MDGWSDLSLLDCFVASYVTGVNHDSDSYEIGMSEVKYPELACPALDVAPFLRRTMPHSFAIGLHCSAHLQPYPTLGSASGTVLADILIGAMWARFHR